MNFKTEFFLARRYLRPKRSAVSVITCISVIGVLLGVAVLIVVLAVMTGFTDLMREKLLAVGAHVQIDSPFYKCIQPDKAVDALKAHHARAAAIVSAPALLQFGQQLLPKQVMGVYPDQIDQQMNLKKMLIAGSFRLRKNEIVVSDYIARQLGLRLGSKVLLHSPEKLLKLVDLEKNRIKLKKTDEVYLPAEFTVAGIYSLGKRDFDLAVMFIGLEDADELFLFDWGMATAVYGWIDRPDAIDQLAAQLRAELPGDRVRTWKQLNEDLLNVLMVEKNMMFFLLVFIVLVAAFSITNTLITMVFQKTREIGLLKALGATSATVMRIFILQGMFVGMVGSVLGTVAGIIIIRWRNEILHFASRVFKMELFPPEFYYFNGLPANIVVQDVVVIVLVTIILCTVGGIVPAWRAAKLDPAKALRNE
ncbi:MAG: ABC transporter permease [Victivallaceae bacterium]|nr:ABC transporter permease [Victivallaceae bacterium]